MTTVRFNLPAAFSNFTRRGLAVNFLLLFRLFFPPLFPATFAGEKTVVFPAWIFSFNYHGHPWRLLPFLVARGGDEFGPEKPRGGDESPKLDSSRNEPSPRRRDDVILCEHLSWRVRIVIISTMIIYYLKILNDECVGRERDSYFLPSLIIG